MNFNIYKSDLKCWVLIKMLQVSAMEHLNIPFFTSITEELFYYKDEFQKSTDYLWTAVV